MIFQVRDKFDKEFTNLFVGAKESDSFKISNIRIVLGSLQENIKKELEDFNKCISDGEKPNDYAEVILLACNGSLFYLYSNINNDNTDSLTLCDETLYVNGYAITPFGCIKDLASSPFINYSALDGLIVCEIDIKDSFYNLEDTFEENLLYDDDAPKLIPLVYELLALAPEAVRNDIAKEYVDSFINSYDKVKDKYGNLSESEDEKTIVFDIETSGLLKGNSIHNIFADVPKTYIPKSDGNLFSV